MVDIIICCRCKQKLRCCDREKEIEHWSKCKEICPSRECSSLEKPHNIFEEYCHECLKFCS